MGRGTGHIPVSRPRVTAAPLRVTAVPLCVAGSVALTGAEDGSVCGWCADDTSLRRQPHTALPARDGRVLALGLSQSGLAASLAADGMLQVPPIYTRAATALHVTLQVPSACAACALAHAPHIHTIHAACPLQAWAWAGGSGTLRRRNSGCAEAGEGEGGAGGEGGGEGEGAPLRAAALAVSHGAGLALTVAAASCAVRVWQLGGGGSGGGSGGSGAGVGGGGSGGDGGRPSLACKYVGHAPQHVVAVAACEGFPLAASTSGGDIHVWALRDGTPVARLLGEGSPWTACALHGGALLTGAYAGVLGLFHLGGLVQQLDGAAVALEPAATRAAAGEVPAAGKAAAGLADADAARVSHDSAELVGDEAEDAAAEALQVQGGGGGGA